MRRYGLSDSQRERTKNLLPGHEGHVDGMTEDSSLFVKAALYRYHAGIPLHDLPVRSDS